MKKDLEIKKRKKVKKEVKRSDQRGILIRANPRKSVARKLIRQT